MVRDQLGLTLPRPLLAEVHEASGGNPFFALEIVRTLRRNDVSVEAGQPLPVPKSLHDLVHARLLALPREPRRPARRRGPRASPDDRGRSRFRDNPTAGSPRRWTRASSSSTAVASASRIRCSPPGYEAADPMRRVQIHARLADLLEDPEARAWQLAASVEEPDESVAVALEDAAVHARSRGALRPAALLLDRARELTASDRPDEAVRRAVDAAFLHFKAGDSRRAEAQLRDLIAPLPPGRVRARALNARSPASARMRRHATLVSSSSRWWPRQTAIARFSRSRTRACRRASFGSWRTSRRSSGMETSRSALLSSSATRPSPPMH